MAKDDTQEPGADTQGVVASGEAPQFKEYTYQGHPDDKIGDDIFHRAAGHMRKGQKVLLSDVHAEELRVAGYKLTGPKE